MKILSTTSPVHRPMWFAIIAFAACAWSVSWAQNYIVTDLDPSGDYSLTVANDISDYGQIIGHALSADAKPHAFSWLGGTTSLLPDLGAERSSALSVNLLGQIVGQLQYRNAKGGLESRPFFYAAGQTVEIQPTGTSGGIATGINNHGMIVGSALYTDEDVTRRRPFVYQNGVSNPLPAISNDPVPPIVTAAAVNGLGQIVGQHQTSAGQTGALWDSGTARFISPAVPADINHAGIVVGTELGAGAIRPQAVRYDTNTGQYTNLGTLGGETSRANAVNDSGVIVGYSTVAGNESQLGQRGFLYRDGAMVDLNTLIPTDSGWTVTEAKSINNKGQIVGSATRNGETRAVLLTPHTLVNAPRRHIPAPVPSPQLPASTATTLVVVTHGFMSNAASDNSWAGDLAAEIRSRVDGSSSAVMVVDWSDEASLFQVNELYGFPAFGPSAAANAAIRKGQALGEAISRSGYDQVHLIGHSAGAWLIDAAADTLQNTNIKTQLTFLDAYASPLLGGVGKLGSTATFAEHYVDTNAAGGTPLLQYTNSNIANAYNLDVTAGPESNPFAAHAWPYRWYMETIDGTIASADGGWSTAIENPSRNGVFPTFEEYAKGWHPAPTEPEPVLFRELPKQNPFSGVYRTSDTGSSILADPVAGQCLISTADPANISLLELRNAGLADAAPDLENAAWISWLVTTDEPANLILLSFEWTAGSDGLVSLYVNDVLSYQSLQGEMINGEVIVDLGMLLQPGLHNLALRLDGLSAAPVSASFSDMRFALVPEPQILGMLCSAMLITRRQRSTSYRCLAR